MRFVQSGVCAEWGLCRVGFAPVPRFVHSGVCVCPPVCVQKWGLCRVGFVQSGVCAEWGLRLSPGLCAEVGFVQSGFCAEWGLRLSPGLCIVGFASNPSPPPPCFLLGYCDTCALGWKLSAHMPQCPSRNCTPLEPV